MRVLSIPGAITTACLLTTTAASVHCDKVVANDVTWNIEALKGPRSVYYLDTEDTGEPTNTTFTFDLCHTLHHHREEDERGCRFGSWACAFMRGYDPDTKETKDGVKFAWSIAGTIADTGSQLSDSYERIKDSSSEADQEQGLEGVRIHLHGGKVDKKPAKMIASLICDKDAQHKLQKRGDTSPALNLRRRESAKEEDDSDDDKEETPGSETSKPEFISYGPVSDKKGGIEYVLRIRWKTVSACEGEAAKPRTGGEGSWGFFTWLVIIVFLLVAAYLIFGSWLNYNRHGARGWDLLPHGDTIRDIPYLLKDWGRAIVDTVQGTHSRGGYNQI